jgi:hypothetical protein
MTAVHNKIEYPANCQESRISDWREEYESALAGKAKQLVREQQIPLNGQKRTEKLVFDGIVEGHDWVPEGRYCVNYVEHNVQRFPRYGYKLVVTFRIFEGEHSGKLVRAFYNLEKSRKGLVIREGCRWVTEMRDLFPDLSNNLTDPLNENVPLPVSLIQHKLILCKIETAKKKKRDQCRPYSVVRRLIKVATLHNTLFSICL